MTLGRPSSPGRWPRPRRPCAGGTRSSIKACWSAAGFSPQQLDQPTKGVHPPGAGASALGHVLGGDKTIADERGVFLGRTWRLHPDLCAPVVIYWLGSSSAEDERRGMEFLYNPNRLNVATSRTRCVAIVVCGPGVKEVGCGTPRQVVLAISVAPRRRRPTPRLSGARRPLPAGPHATERLFDLVARREVKPLLAHPFFELEVLSDPLLANLGIPFEHLATIWLVVHR